MVIYHLLGEGKGMDPGLFEYFYRIRELFHCICSSVSISVNH